MSVLVEKNFECRKIFSREMYKLKANILISMHLFPTLIKNKFQDMVKDTCLTFNPLCFTLSVHAFISSIIHVWLNVL